MKRSKNKKIKPESVFGAYFFAGIALLVLAFFVLSKADPMAENFAGKVSPFMFITSWGLIIYGLLAGGRNNEK